MSLLGHGPLNSQQHPQSVSRPSQLRPRPRPRLHGCPGGLPRTASNFQHHTPSPASPISMIVNPWRSRRLLIPVLVE